MAFFPYAFLDDNLSDAGDLISFEVFQQISQNCNYLIDAMPVGTIQPIMTGFGGLPEPDPTIWHPCDGSMITEPSSSLRGNPAPDYESLGGKYMRGYITAGSIGNYGGSNTKNLAHDHGGTNIFFAGLNADTDNDFTTAGPHKHNMPMDLTDTNFEPVHLKVKHYIKLR